MRCYYLFILVNVIVTCRSQCTDSAGCYPPLGELTLNRSVTVTSSCTDGDMYTFIGGTLACDTTLNSALSINDDDFDTMWVSGIDGDLLLPLIVQLDFEGPVFFYSTNITWASRTPSAMSLERNNGSDWLPYRYYADNCMKYYNLTDSVVVPNEAFPDQEPVCTSLGLQILSPGAVIMFETASHLSNGTSEEDYNSYQLVHGLRIVVDEINENSLFGPIANLVSISEWSAEGTCMCNGHASMCSPIEGEDVYPNKVYTGCECSHNTSGLNCEHCASGYTHRPWQAANETSANECIANCGCNPEASVPDTCDEVTGQCNCTENAIGLQCMDCPATHYQTAGISQDYCTQCICFGLSTSCVGDNDNYILTTIESDFGTVCGSTIDINICAMNWAIMDVSFTFPSSDGLLYFIYNGENPTFVAPEMYHGDFKLSYGHSLTIVFILESHEFLPSSYIRISSSKNSLYSSYPSPSVNGDRYTFTIPFIESYWRIGSIDGPVASISDLINVLADVNDFRFTGKFGSGIIQTNHLNFVSWPHILTTSEGSGSGDELFSNLTQYTVQSCNCSPGHKGQFCEECTMGYYSTIDSLTEPCIECDCNNLSVSCDTPSGNCTNCTGNSQGSNCEKCMPGYYGDPTNAISCVECDCNNRSMTCNSDGVCDNCDEGYRGDKCDVCESGFYDPSNGCNKMCACNPIGSINMSCNATYGQCNCKENINGIICADTNEGYYYHTLDSIVFEAEETDSNLPVITSLLGKETFSGSGFLQVPSSGATIIFTVEVPITSNYFIVVRYASSVDISGVLTVNGDNGYSFVLSSSETSEPINGDFSDSIPISISLQENTQYEIMLSCFENEQSTDEWLLDSIILVPDIVRNSTYYETLVDTEKISILLCLPLSLPVIRDTFCDLTAFEFSIEFYGQVFLCEEPNLFGVEDPASECGPHGRDFTCNSNYTGSLCDQCANGYYNSSGLCEMCPSQCDAMGSFNEACDMQTGGCQCRSNVIGDTCNKCLNGTYNLTSNGCSDCNCSQYASSNECDDDGVCACPDNIAEPKCEECQDGYYNISVNGCTICGCNPEASVSDTCDEVTGQCNCTENAIGLQCMDCPATHYQTAGISQDYCTQCICFGQSTSCVGDNDTYILTTIENDFGTVCGNTSDINICTMDWAIMDVSFNLPSSDGFLYFNDENPTFIAPEMHHGDFKLSYGHSLTIVFILESRQEFLTSSYIRISSSNNSLYSSYPSPSVNEDRYTFTIPFIESYWRIGSIDGPVASISDLINVLADVNDFTFTGKFGSGINQTNHLNFVSWPHILTTSEGSGSGDELFSNLMQHTVQSCNCSPGHKGQFCEECITGYYNNGSGCQLCNCDTNGALPEICDNNGTCLCKDNTNDDCSECLEGYYGNVTNNENCLGCPCPTANNTHAASCFVDTDNMIICMCNKAYTGTNCEECSEGYFGDALNGICNDCTCNGNFDEALGSICDMTTGFCINCTNNTFGAECENCDNGYSGDPISNIPCTSCSSCSINGTIPEICGMVSGMCLCKENVTGVNCNKCINGTYGAPDQLIDCRPCPCENIDNPICSLHNMSGAICENCGPAYEGQHCENCANGYYRDQNNACVECECYGNVDPQLGLTCDPDNGTCLNCLNNTTGPNCNECITGYYGDIPNGIPCQICDCYVNGTQDDVCNPVDGTCICLPGKNGMKCSSCALEFWEANPEMGCQPCECCLNGSNSTVCDQTNGQCLCHEGVGGLQCCDGCAPGYFNFTAGTGCTECECNAKIMSPICNDTGYCDCVEGAIGMKCDQCSSGYIDNGLNCTECHDCFFLWNRIVTDLNNDATAILNRIKRVLQFYKGFNVSTVLGTVALIEESLTDTDQNLAMLFLDVDVFGSISTSLNEVQATYGELYKDVMALNISLMVANETMQNITADLEMIETFISKDMNAFNLQSNISAYRTLIQTLQFQAALSFEVISLNQREVIKLRTIVDTLVQNITATDELLEAVNVSNSSVETAKMSALLGQNISVVSSSLEQLEFEVDEFFEDLSNEVIDVDELVVKLEILEKTLESFNSQLKSITMLSDTLEQSTLQVKEQADNVFTNVEIIKNATNTTLESSKLLIKQIESSQGEAFSLDATLSDIKVIMSKLNLVSSPSIDQATSLAVAINTTIIPEEEVSAVVENVNDARGIAQKLYSGAVDASEQVKDLQMLLDSVQSDKSAIENIIDETEGSLDNVTNNVDTIKDNLEISNNNMSPVSTAQNEFATSLSLTQSDLSYGIDALNQLDKDVNEAEMDSKEIKNVITAENDKIEDVASTVDELNQNATTKMDVSVSNMNRAKSAKESSSQSNSDAVKVAVNDLTGLLTNYKSILADVSEARKKVKELEEELETLSSSFNEASTKFKNCYKTP